MRALLVALALCLAGCGSGGGDNNTASSTGEAAPIALFIGEASWMVDPATYGTVADDLRAKGYDVRSFALPLGGDLNAWAHEAQVNPTWIADYVKGFGTSMLPTLGSRPVVIIGTSRGAFFAMQLAAVYPVLHYVVGMSPAIDLATLSEFAGMAVQPNVYGLAPALAGRSIFMEIGSADLRVGTENPGRLADAIKQTPGSDVTVIVGPAIGHTVPASTFDDVVQWIGLI